MKRLREAMGLSISAAVVTGPFRDVYNLERKRSVGYAKSIRENVRGRFVITTGRVKGHPAKSKFDVNCDAKRK